MQNDFKTGWLYWRLHIITFQQLCEEYLSKAWQDGFLAFSNCEKRWTNFPPDKIQGLFAARNSVSDADGCDGFVMEAGMWRNHNGIYEECAIERSGDAFSVQYWCLYDTDTEQPKEDAMRCYFREADTSVRKNLKIFSEKLKTFEVVVPNYRLHFYLVKGV